MQHDDQWQLHHWATNSHTLSFSWRYRYVSVEWHMTWYMSHCTVWWSIVYKKAAVGCWKIWSSASVFWLVQQIDWNVIHECAMLFMHKDRWISNGVVGAECIPPHIHPCFVQSDRKTPSSLQYMSWQVNTLNIIFVARAVTLAGNANQMFRGFLVVALSGNQRVGSFAPDANGKVACAVSMHKCSRQWQG